MSSYHAKSPFALPGNHNNSLEKSVPDSMMLKGHHSKPANRMQDLQDTSPYRNSNRKTIASSLITQSTNLKE